MLTALLIIITVVSALALTFLVLLHTGRGGGISDMLGGSMGQVVSGSTVAEKNLDRLTIAVALVFAFAALALDLRLQ
jgi:preprotein translocase subunit SecG